MSKKLNEKVYKEFVNNSNDIIKDFKLYFAAFYTQYKKQVSLLTEDEYNKMQAYKFIGSSHEEKFFKNLPDDVKYVDVKTFVLTEDNLGLAFHPMVWKVLTYDQKIAVCRLVRQKYEKKDFKKFCFNNSKEVVIPGKKYDGVFNVGSLVDEPVSEDNLLSIDFLIEILNGPNDIKNAFFRDRAEASKKKYKAITDFDSLEELQYDSPLLPRDPDKLEPIAKAYYYDDIYVRRRRSALQEAYDLISCDAAVLEDFTPSFDKFLKSEQKRFIEMDTLVIQQLGSTRQERDEKYLEIMVTILNNDYTRKYNEIASKYNELLEKKKRASSFNESAEYDKELKMLEKEIKKVDKKEIDLEEVKKHFAKDLKRKPIKIKSNKKENAEELQKMN